VCRLKLSLINATGGSLSGVSISGGSVSGATVSGSTLSGNTLSGTTTNGGTISGGTMSGATINGGAINGTVSNAGTVLLSGAGVMQANDLYVGTNNIIRAFGTTAIFYPPRAGVETWYYIKNVSGSTITVNLQAPGSGSGSYFAMLITSSVTTAAETSRTTLQGFSVPYTGEATLIVVARRNSV